MQDTFSSFFADVPDQCLNQPQGLDFADFLAQSPFDHEEDMKLMEGAVKDHNKLVFMMRHRIQSLKQLQKMWTRNNMEVVVNELAMVKDQAVMVDALAATFGGGQKADLLSVEQCNLVLTKCVDLMVNSKYEAHLAIALTTTKHLFKAHSETALKAMSDPS